MPSSFATVILAGGKATRLPGKLFATLGEQTILDRVVSNMRMLADECIVSISAHGDEIGTRYGLASVRDAISDRGPLGGALAAAENITSQWMFLAPGDAPFVDADFVRTLADARGGHEAVVARDPSGRVHPLPAFYSRAALLEHAPRVFAANRRSFRALLERLDVKIVDVNDARPLTNVNTPGDLERLRRETDGTNRAIGE